MRCSVFASAKFAILCSDVIFDVRVLLTVSEKQQQHTRWLCQWQMTLLKCMLIRVLSTSVLMYSMFGWGFQMYALLYFWATSSTCCKKFLIKMLWRNCYTDADRQAVEVGSSDQGKWKLILVWEHNSNGNSFQTPSKIEWKIQERIQYY